MLSVLGGFYEDDSTPITPEMWDWLRWRVTMSDKWEVRMLNPEDTILEEIQMRGIKQKDIAQTYAFLLKDPDAGDLDWRTINQAIIDRWSVSGLERIKKMAWDGSCFEGEG